jgi:hypothetical protein
VNIIAASVFSIQVAGCFPEKENAVGPVHEKEPVGLDFHADLRECRVGKENEQKNRSQF